MGTQGLPRVCSHIYPILLFNRLTLRVCFGMVKDNFILNLNKIKGIGGKGS